MKHFIFRGIGFFTLVSLFAAIVINVHISYRTNTDMEFILTNVEALAQGEGDDGDTGCGGSGNVSCGGSYHAWKLSR